jgi:hypothetical protein
MEQAMTVLLSAVQASGGTARTAPPIPGLEQGNPAVTNRQAPAPGTPQTTPPAQPQTSQEIRDEIRNQIRTSIQNGGGPVINVPPDFNARNAVPQGAVDISVAFFVSMAAIFILGPLARALARRMDVENQRKVAGGSELAPQIEQLQQSVDAMSIELERITEAQRFQSKLLVGREKEPEVVRLQR